MPNQNWVSIGPNIAVADGAPYASSVTLTAVSPAPDFTFPANYLSVGQRIKVEASGIYSTTSAPTLNLGLYYGGTAGVAMLTTGAVASISGAANTSWAIKFNVDVRTIGASGTALIWGRVEGLTAATAFALLPATAITTATIDTTAAKALVLGATWGTNSASNTLTVKSFKIYIEG